MGKSDLKVLSGTFLNHLALKILLKFSPLLKRNIIYLVLYSNYFCWEADEDNFSLLISTGCERSNFALPLSLLLLS